MGIFEQLFGEFGLPARAVVALVLVLALIALTVWLMRRFGDSRLVQRGGRGRQQRLAVLDSTVVDARRKLVLIRRDNVEHLILIGGPTDVVVEPNIVRAAPLGAPGRPPRPSAYEAPEADESSLVPQAEPAYPEPERAPPREPVRPAYPPRTMPRPTQRTEPQYADMAQRLEAALRKTSPELEVAQRPAPVRPRPPEPRTPEPRAPEARAPQARAPEPPAPELHPATPPPPPPVTPAAPAPRAPEPRSYAPPPPPPPPSPPRVPEAKTPEPRSPETKAPEPKTPEPKSPETKAPEPKTPEPKKPEAKTAETPSADPAKPQTAVDVFESLEEEMASLLRPSDKKDQ